MSSIIHSQNRPFAATRCTTGIIRMWKIDDMSPTTQVLIVRGSFPPRAPHPNHLVSMPYEL